MSELEERLRRSLKASTQATGDITPEVLAERLLSRRASYPRPVVGRGPGPTGPDELDDLAIASSENPVNGIRFRPWLIGAAAVVLIAAVAGVAYRVSRDPGHSVIADGASATAGSGFEDWEAGWHQIDVSGLPDMGQLSMVWFQNRLVLSAGGYQWVEEDVSNNWVGSLRAFDPGDQEWTTLPVPPVENTTIVAAGDQLVAVGAAPGTGLIASSHDPVRWATWTWGDAEWVDRGGVPVARPYAELGVAPLVAGVHEMLLWTGDRVFDLTRGAALDPTSSTAGVLAAPENVLLYMDLLVSAPVWTGSEVVWSSWSDGPGLAWNSTGDRLREIPPPTGAGPDGGYASVVAAADGSVVLVPSSGAVPGELWAFEPGADKWTSLPPAPPPAIEQCGRNIASRVGEHLVLTPCSDMLSAPGRSFDFSDARWTEVKRPQPELPPGVRTLLGTDHGLVVWTSGAAGADYPGTESGPIRSLAVWIPPT